MTTETIAGPWLAFSRTGPSHRSSKASIDHATADGRTTLCGLSDIGGWDATSLFDSQNSFACRRCIARLARRRDEEKRGS